MGFVAFYAPMKPPDDPVPSGDRTMARSLCAALDGAGLGEVRLISRLRCRDGKGDAAAQDAIFRAAKTEAGRLAETERPDLWLTYHSYYKAPDLLGPPLSRLWGIPYAQVEATRAKKRLAGPHARFAEAAELACDAADVIFYVTDLDRRTLERDRPPGQALVRLRPFLDRASLPALERRPHDGPARLVACAMFRHADKLDSYRALAAALALVEDEAWTLAVIGDGPARAAVEALFSGFGERVTFVGALGRDEVAARFRDADLLVWPGVGEAFGMVYLEAQAEGCAVLAEDRPGVRDVVRDGGWLTPSDDAAAYAGAIRRLVADRGMLAQLGRQGRAQIAADHLLAGARQTLVAALRPLVKESGR